MSRTYDKDDWRWQNPDIVYPEPVDPETWWREFHSGIDALQSARDILASPRSMQHYDLSIRIIEVCSELIFRVTGEKIVPAQGVSRSILDGEYFIG